MKFVTYLRVSTPRQGRSGLGLEAQREAVSIFSDARGAEVVSEFVEIETGSRNNRPELARAIQCAKECRAVLLIAKLDRLARSVALISSLMEANVEFVAADNPHASRLMLHLLAAFAEHERSEISARTKAALAAARARGVVLGVNGKRLATKAKVQALLFANLHHETLSEIFSTGPATVRRVATELNARGISSPEGGAWGPGNCGRLLNRIARISAQNIGVRLEPLGVASS